MIHLNFWVWVRGELMKRKLMSLINFQICLPTGLHYTVRQFEHRFCTAHGHVLRLLREFCFEHIQWGISWSYNTWRLRAQFLTTYRWICLSMLLLNNVNIPLPSFMQQHFIKQPFTPTKKNISQNNQKYLLYFFNNVQKYRKIK